MFLRSLRSVVASTIPNTPHQSTPSCGRWVQVCAGRAHSPSRYFRTSGFKLLNTAEKLEEENWDWYSADAYYPVRLGDTFQSRYQVLGKLGYGAHSTVWLGRDVQAHRYVTLKICERDSSSARREVAAYKHLGSLTVTHAGVHVVRQLLDSFKIDVPGGEHLCLVHEPLGISLDTFTRLLPGGHLSEDVLKSILKYLLLALDYLHSEGKTIHADLQARNLHFRPGDDGIFQYFEEQELKNPSPRKVDGDRIIYESRGLRLPNKIGPPILCDFGEARYGKDVYTDDIQPFLYRAPEIILDMPWSYEVDIWNVGVMIWDLFEGRHLFSAEDANGDQRSLYHLAEMCALLGPPPLDYLQRSETSWKFFEADGTCKAVSLLPDSSLEASERRLSGDNKAHFLTFVREMLQWLPEKRQTANQLLQDPWLNEP